MLLGRSITAICFWLGTVLPVAYLPVFLSGIDSITGLSLFVGLVALHVLTLIVGHEYDGFRTRSQGEQHDDSARPRSRTE